ncbi:hypothetical protein LJR225_004862 [Phenylobacterium sp. LjRoot225]|uniref:hypothetical protein n=1 Tax=Phenylobacterium sp. LjRoot225 TaxID=3342285 RepID=UPI003ECE50B9
MTAADPVQAGQDAFSARSVLALILVGIVALAGFGALATYAPELRGRSNGGGHALSGSAVGFRGARDMLVAIGVPATVSRTRLSSRQLTGTGLVLTPSPMTPAAELGKFPTALRTLIILPKWQAAPDPRRPGFVLKAGALPDGWAKPLLSGFGPGTRVTVTPGAQRPVLYGTGLHFAPQQALPLGPFDGLQTISGPDWRPVLVDGQGRAVLAASRSHAYLYVLADPDLLNNQGLSDIDTARVGMAVLQMLSGEDGVAFDVTLNGLGQGRSLARLMLEPPWLAATLCGLAAVLLTGWQALARFAAPAAEGRAIALGAAALVDNSAGLIRMGGKEAALAPDYAAVTFNLVAKAGGIAAPAAGGPETAAWLARAAEQRGLTDPQALAADAGAVRTRDELMAVADSLYQWRLEMTRERE